MFQLSTADNIPKVKLASLLEDIRVENPDYWPHGLTVDHFDPDNLWAITKKANSEPVGFVGWQDLNSAGERLGCYSIGVLPDYRRLGLAKEAVAHVINEKRATVDRVVAYVAKGNEPSLALAGKLDDVILKQANWGKILSKILPRAAGGATTAIGMDQLYGNVPIHGPGTAEGGFFDSPLRKAVGVLNAAIGARAGGKAFRGKLPFNQNAARSIGAGVSAAPSAIFKDLGVAGVMNVGPAVEALKGMASKDDSPEVNVEGAGKLAPLAIAAALLGAGGLAYKGLTKEKPSDRGRMRVFLPTANPRDRETEVDIPLENEMLSGAMQSNVRRDLKRRLREGGKARTLSKGRNLFDVTQVQA